MEWDLKWKGNSANVVRYIIEIKYVVCKVVCKMPFGKIKYVMCSGEMTKLGMTHLSGVQESLETVAH